MKKLLAIILSSALLLSLLVSCSTKDTQDSQTDSLTETVYDVVIVGAGGGGLSAALSAVRNGAQSVVVLERMPMTGGSLNTTSGTMSGANTIIQELDGLTEDSLESYKNDIITEGEKLGGEPNEALVDIYVEGATTMIDFMWEAGLSDNEFTTDADGNKSVYAPEHTLYSYPRSYKAKPHDAEKYKSSAHELLDELVAQEEKITVLLNTEVTALKANEEGQVLSAVATFEGQEAIYTANYGIIMATGGYSGNPDLMGEFSDYGDVVITGGLPSADGNGLRLMQTVGAALNEESMGWIPTYPMGLESLEIPGTGRIATTKTQYAGGILVNVNGERFVNETDADNVAREVALEHQPEGIQYEIYTDKIGEDLIASGQGAFLQYFFMTPAFADYVVTASSLEELSEKLDIPTDTFLQTVADYNASVDSQTTDEFGRVYDETSSPFNVAINKIEGEKFYAVAIKPLAIVTMGGVEVNNNLQVLDEEGNVIPGLYAAGETLGGVWGRYISSGVGVMGPIVFGDYAAEQVLTQELQTGYEVKEATNILSADLFEKETATAGVELSLEGVKDGTYSVEVDGQDGNLMTVEVSFEGEVITNVEIVSHGETLSIAQPALDAIPNAIVDSNSVNVDMIADATLTSQRIVNAVVKAAELAKE